MIVLLLAAVLSQEPRVSVAKPLLAYSLSAGMDLASTEYGLARGYSEGNPLMQDRSARIAVAVLSTALLSAADVNLQRSGKRSAARALRITVFVVRVGITAHNLAKAR